MRITKEVMDGIRGKWSKLTDVVKLVFSTILTVGLAVLLAFVFYKAQYGLAGERYLLFRKINTIMPLVSLGVYKKMVSVFVSGVYVVAYVLGKLLTKKIVDGKVGYKVTFDEMSTLERFCLMVRRVKTILNLVVSILVAVFLYKKEYYGVLKKAEIFALCSGLVFFVKMQVLCRFGCIVDRLVVNPIKCLVCYIFYLMFTVWFVILTSVSVAKGVLNLFVLVFLVIVIWSIMEFIYELFLE